MKERERTSISGSMADGTGEPEPQAPHAFIDSRARCLVLHRHDAGPCLQCAVCGDWVPESGTEQHGKPAAAPCPKDCPCHGAGQVAVSEGRWGPTFDGFPCPWRTTREAEAEVAALRVALSGLQRRVGHGADCNDHAECKDARAALAGGSGTPAPSRPAKGKVHRERWWGAWITHRTGPPFLWPGGVCRTRRSLVEKWGQKEWKSWAAVGLVRSIRVAVTWSEPPEPTPTRRSRRRSRKAGGGG